MDNGRIQIGIKRSPEVSIFNRNVIGTIAGLQLICVFVFGTNLYYQTAMLISITQFTLLFYNIGRIVPIRLLVGALFSINFLISPVLMFEFLNDNVLPDYRMVGSPDVYLSYAIPSILMLILGLNMFKTNDSQLDVKKISAIAVKYHRLPFYLIIIGLLCDFIAPYMPSEISLIFYSIGYFKFAGFFLSLFNGRPVNYIYFMLSYGLIIITSVISSLFNDFLNLLFFLGFMLALRYKPTATTKALAVGCIVLVVVFIQIIKFPLRQKVNGNVNDLSLLNSAIEEGSLNNGQKTTKDKIADVVSRIDEGWVTAKSIEYQSAGGYKFQNGEHMLVVMESAVFPRLLVPDKLQVGDAQEFNKYSGHTVQSGTSIALGLLTDGYVDFGYWGIFVVFGFGMVISLFIRIYHKMDKKYPLVKLFLPIGFFYAVRPDTDTQSALGAVIKVTFVIWLAMMYIDNNGKLFIQKKKKKVIGQRIKW